MPVIFDPSVPVGTDRPWLDAERALAARVRMVLETQPGTLPWRPDFGCDLAELVGYPATPRLVAQARWRVESALKTWLPDVEVVKVGVPLVPNDEGMRSGSSRSVPVAESSLITVGVQARLSVDIELKGPDGPFGLSTTLQP